MSANEETVEDADDQQHQPADLGERDVGGTRGQTPLPKGQVRVMDGERVAFTEESQPGQYLKLIASGDVDDFMLEALEDYVKRQRRRLQAAGEGQLN